MAVHVPLEQWTVPLASLRQHRCDIQCRLRIYCPEELVCHSATRDFGRVAITPCQPRRPGT